MAVRSTLLVANVADCCRPAMFDLWAIVFARGTFVADMVHQMEATHPQAVGEMVAFTSARNPFMYIFVYYMYAYTIIYLKYRVFCWLAAL